MTGTKPAYNRHCNAETGQKNKQVGIFFDRNRLRSCLETRVLEVALRLWSLQGAMGAKIRTVVNYTTQFLPPS
ncbi:MAG: hypothetical protein BECKG1743D_GA0114223_109033 [Candidatus Kentron sp. G]|nr:MAG: hypothetical protein BECKG1743F_GA0114225_107031 [Candidatus Kentron sp. G]VFN05662.1 MAG: hypothetical protein BECKG1743E_GA0114224_108981 [Candidatus Kentron sp. G]VFN06707.1 MAG: hypothetical protein BECKG1743D_GA0114223_109033 [Candidatus Kentron sp. G]